uniref:RING-type domain-containing protein n=1 Tax=Alexandrium monilatum TaxID=311494 RepID=A0A7S4T1P8_9DINO
MASILEMGLDAGDRLAELATAMPQPGPAAQPPSDAGAFCSSSVRAGAPPGSLGVTASGQALGLAPRILGSGPQPSLTPLRWLLAAPGWARAYALDRLQQLDPSGFLTRYIWFVALAVAVWLISSASLLSRNPRCRHVLRGLWDWWCAPSTLPTLGIALLALSVLVVHDAAVMPLLELGHYVTASAQAFGGCALAASGLAEPKMKAIRLRTALAGLELAGGLLFVPVCLCLSVDLQLEGRRGASVGAARAAAFGSGLIGVHGLGRLLAVPLLLRLSQAVSYILLSAARYLIAVPIKTCSRSVQWLWHHAVFPFARCCALRSVQAARVIGRTLTAVYEVVCKIALAVWRPTSAAVARAARLCQQAGCYVLECAGEVLDWIARHAESLVRVASECCDRFICQPLSLAARCAYHHIARVARMLLDHLTHAARAARQHLVEAAAFLQQQVNLLYRQLSRATTWVWQHVRRVAAHVCRHLGQAYDFALRRAKQALTFVSHYATLVVIWLYQRFVEALAFVSHYVTLVVIWLHWRLVEVLTLIHRCVTQAAALLCRHARQLFAFLRQHATQAAAFVGHHGMRAAIWLHSRMREVSLFVYRQTAQAVAWVGGILRQVFDFIHRHATQVYIFIYGLLRRAACLAYDHARQAAMALHHGLALVALFLREKACLAALRLRRWWDWAAPLVWAALVRAAQVVLIPLMRLAGLGFRVGRRLVSPAGCFTSAGLFAYHLHGQLRGEAGARTSVLALVGYGLAIHGSASIGLLLLGRVIRRSGAGAWMVSLGHMTEATGAWLFLHLDLTIISVCRQLVRETSNSVLTAARFVAGALKWIAQRVELILDGAVRGTWVAVRTAWQHVILPALALLTSMAWAGICTVWQNPLLSMAASAGFVAYLYQVHVGKAPLPDFAGWASLGLQVARAVMGIVGVALAALRHSLAVAAGGGAVLARGTARTASTAWSFAKPLALESQSLATALSRRPLELYSEPAFAQMAALVTLLCSRVVLLLINHSRTPMTSQEIVELCARVGRTSQRMLFVPVVSSALISGLASRLALGLAQLVAVPLALVYLFGSLVFLTSEMRGWAATSRELKEHRRARACAQAPEHIFSEARDDCCICMEALSPPEQEPWVPPPPPQRALVLVRLENGPRHRWYGKFEVVLEAADLEGPQPQPLRSPATAGGEWRLAVNAGPAYRLRLLDSNGQCITEISFRIPAEGQPLDGPAPDAEPHMEAGALGGGPPASWSFPGQHRRDQRQDSRVELWAVPRVADGVVSEDAQTLPVGVQVLELPERQPPAPPPPPLPVAALRCGHAFHEPCIKAWLRRNTRCPMCREVVRGFARHAFQAVF